MKNLYFIALVSLIFAGTIRTGKSQNAYVGTDFWVTFMPNNGTNGTMTLYITAATASTATVTIPNASPVWSSTVAIASNAIVSLSIPSSTGGVTMADPAAGAVNTTAKTGIHIVSDNPVSVYGMSEASFSAEAYIAIPTINLGTDYITISPEGLSTAPAAFIVVATQPATTVNFTLPAGKTAVGHAAGSSWSVSLNQGETYLGTATTTGLAGDITGTIITANKPIAVLSGAECMQFPASASKAGYANCGACDYGIEQLTPTSTWGKNFIAAEFLSPALASRTNSSYIRVVAYDPGTTTFSVSGYPAQTLTGKGNYMDYKVTGGIVISSDKPIAAYAIASGNQCYTGLLGPGDASIIALVPQEQWGVNSPFVCPSGYTSTINILAKKASPAIILDGAAVTGFTAIGTTGFYRKSLSVATGNHLATSVADSFMVYVYGENTAISYAYSAAGPTLMPIALPISLVSFHAKNKENKEVNLAWTTAMEKNSSRFELERSTNGIDFSVISRFKGAGNAITQNHYTYSDMLTAAELIHATTIYYRLKQVDFDGNYSYSGVVSVSVHKPFGTIIVSPQPLSNVGNIIFEATRAALVSVTLYDIVGKAVYHTEKECSEGTNSIELNLSEIPEGVYHLQVSGISDESQYIKVFKQ